MNRFPDVRMRRLRRTPALRRLFDAPAPGPEKFIWPAFVIGGENRREPIASMPGQYRWSVDGLLGKLEGLARDGIGGVLLFGLGTSACKDETGRQAWAEDGVVPAAVSRIKAAYPDLLVFTDVCLCAYTRHGHCGVLDAEGNVENDETNKLLARIALAHAAAGADGVAPSAMMDGQVAALRGALERQGFPHTLIMSYSTKFASCMYGPFRDAEQSAPGRGDRKGYQASWGDGRQAIRESVLDEEEGADVLMVKPALFYLDIIRLLRDRTDLPVAAYNVSGEYAMVAAAAEKGCGNLREMVRESTAAMARAGADIIISYWADRYVEWFEG